jgi:stage V sporulation protein D (sporulation-specific penicillin-binding protein)
MALPNTNSNLQNVRRVRIWYGCLVAVMIIFGIRLFYVQVIRYTHYKDAALSVQLKQYQIPAERGIIEAQDAGQVLPLVLNQKLYTLYADPTFITNASQTATQLTPIIGGSASQYSNLMKTKDTRYVILAKKLTEAQSNAILALKSPGLGTQEQDYRIYPDGSLASQLLGFVDNNGVGQYGIEQALNKQLAGVPGQVKAVTDANGVPLAADSKNIEIAPQNGKNVVLSIDLAMQTQMESILANEYQKTKSQGISAIIMDPSNGQIKAMANYPTYNPTNYSSVTNPALFQNNAVSNAIEPGSSMKTLTTSAALDQGVIQPNTTFYDPAHWLVDGFNITDIEQDGGPREQSIASTLALSLNTGATWMLMQMGGGSINAKGINAWNNYLTNHFRLGEPTNVEQGYESAGYVPPANLDDPSIDLTYAETSFGQGIQVTALQMISALSSILNGGTYYQPTLVSKYINADGSTTVNKPKVVEKNVVSPKVGQELIPLMENVVTTYLHEGYSFMNFSPDYMVGGKTGTAQIAQPSGGYYANKFNGTYIGFVGGDKVQYVIVVFNSDPDVPGYAGALGGQPVFADLAHMLINNSDITPKS